MAFTQVLLWTWSTACPRWIDGVYSGPPLDQINCLSRWTDGVYSGLPVDQINCLSYLDRWRLFWSSCGPGQLPVLPGQVVFTLILLWTKLAVCPTWTDRPVDQINCLYWTWTDGWRLLWSSHRSDQLLVLPGQMAFTLIPLWIRLIACRTWTDGWRLLWSSYGPDQLLVLPGQMAFSLVLLWTRLTVYLDGQMAFTLSLLWTRSTACPIL